MIVALLAVIVGLPLVMRTPGHGGAASVAPGAERLVVLTPHNEQIRYEFSRAYNAWRGAQDLGPVHFDWRTSGGTSDLRKSVFDQFASLVRTGREDEGIGCDLFFGGGDYEHGRLAAGISIARDGQTVQIPLTVPVELAEGLLEQAYPEPTIGGEPLYHPQLRWVGVALSSFGIVYNRDVLRMIGPDEPTRWSDLKDGRYLQWIALSDPAHSGSIAATYNAILRREGWDEGWRLLRRVFANARYFSSGSPKVPVDVSAGEAAAGMCIDFYGRFQAGAVGGDRVGYVDPRHMTAITADPISILRGAPQRALANDFVVWQLSPAAQDLWQLRRGAEGGPQRFELRRLPVRRDRYTAEAMADWVDVVHPFEIARPFPDGMPNFYRAVAPIAHALAIDVHPDLRAAWQAILTQKRPEKKRRMIAAFDAMPCERGPDGQQRPVLAIDWPDAGLAGQWETALGDPEHPRRAEVVDVLDAFMRRLSARLKDSDRRIEEQLAWTRFFRNQYRQVLLIAAE